MSTNEKITCKLCGAQEHVIKSHLAKDHPGVSIEQYQAQFPGAPVMSA